MKKNILTVILILCLSLLSSCSSQPEIHPEVYDGPLDVELSELPIRYSLPAYREAFNTRYTTINEETAKALAITYIKEYQTLLNDKAEKLKATDSESTLTEITLDVELIDQNVHIDAIYCSPEDVEPKCVYGATDKNYKFQVMDVYKYGDEEKREVSTVYKDIPIYVNMISGRTSISNSYLNEPEFNLWFDIEGIYVNGDSVLIIKDNDRFIQFTYLPNCNYRIEEKTMITEKEDFVNGVIRVGVIPNILYEITDERYTKFIFFEDHLEISKTIFSTNEDVDAGIYTKVDVEKIISAEYDFYP